MAQDWANRSSTSRHSAYNAPHFDLTGQNDEKIVLGDESGPCEQRVRRFSAADAGVRLMVPSEVHHVRAPRLRHCTFWSVRDRKTVAGVAEEWHPHPPSQSVNRSLACPTRAAWR